MADYDITLQDEFSTKYTTVSLSNYADYQTTFTLNGVTIFMTVNYNHREGVRSIILESTSSSTLMSQSIVRFGKRCELNFNANQVGLDYYVTLKPIDETKVFDSHYDYYNWADDFQLCFVGWDYSYTVRKMDNIRIYRTGN